MTMEKDLESPQEKAFQEGIQDNSVKITDDNNADPKQQVLNSDPKITNAETRNLLKEDHKGKENNDEELENTVDNEHTTSDDPEIPDTYSPRKMSTQLPTMDEEEE